MTTTAFRSLRMTNNPFNTLNFAMPALMHSCTPPIRMPETPPNIIHDELNYEASLQRFEIKDWLMTCRLSAAGLDYIYVSEDDRSHPRDYHEEDPEIFEFDL